MDMTKDFLDRILAMDEPHTIELGGRLFSDKDLRPLPCGPVAGSPLGTESLSSVEDYILHNTDGDALSNGRFIIHVEGPRSVTLYKEMNKDKRRDCLLKAVANVSEFPFGRFMDVESFIINLQSSFVQDENTAALLAFIASVKTDTGVEQTDDGISQKVTARSGVSLVTSAKVPNPITLRPYRTFSEVEQPESAFVFRVKSDERSGVAMALFEADGSAWKHEAIVSIKKEFEVVLNGERTIILA